MADLDQLSSPLSDAPSRVSASTVVNLAVALRPEQWSKNLLVFAGLLFGLQLRNPNAVGRSLAAFVIFCALSSVVYLINDVLDREADRLHPLKKRRPIASGVLPVRTAVVAAALIGPTALAAAWSLNRPFGLCATAYLSLLTLYSGTLKHVVILDVLTIALGFVLRAAGGALAIGVPISQWLLVCTILGALFLALTKRRHELVLLAEGATGHRRILNEYSPYLLDQMISVVTASTFLSYAFYTMSTETIEKFGTPWLGATIPFPLYGIFRYLYLVHKRQGGGNPSDTLLNDKPLLVCVALWALTAGIIIYRPW